MAEQKIVDTKDAKELLDKLMVPSKPEGKPQMSLFDKIDKANREGQNDGFLTEAEFSRFLKETNEKELAALIAVVLPHFISEVGNLFDDPGFDRNKISRGDLKKLEEILTEYSNPNNTLTDAQKKLVEGFCAEIARYRSWGFITLENRNISTLKEFQDVSNLVFPMVDRNKDGELDPDELGRAQVNFFFKGAAAQVIELCLKYYFKLKEVSNDTTFNDTGISRADLDKVESSSDLAQNIEAELARTAGVLKNRSSIIFPNEHDKAKEQAEILDALTVGAQGNSSYLSILGALAQTRQDDLRRLFQEQADGSVVFKLLNKNDKYRLSNLKPKEDSITLPALTETELLNYSGESREGHYSLPILAQALAGFINLPRSFEYGESFAEHTPANRRNLKVKLEEAIGEHDRFFALFTGHKRDGLKCSSESYEKVCSVLQTAFAKQRILTAVEHKPTSKRTYLSDYKFYSVTPLAKLEDGLVSHVKLWDSGTGKFTTLSIEDFCSSPMSYELFYETEKDLR